jgi:hypothetical protein
MELLKIAGLQGILPLVAILTLIKVSYEKVTYVFSLNDFDKLFIPQNKLKIYETLKYLLTIVSVNIFIMFYSSTFSYDFDISEASSRSVYNIISFFFSLSLIMIIFLILYIKIRNKITFLQSKKQGIIDDWKVIVIFFMIHIVSFALIIGSSFFQVFEYKMINDRSISEGEFFIISTIAAIIYVYIVFRMVIWSRNGKREKPVYKIKLKESGKSLFVLKCKDENILILGNSKTHEESNSIYLYDLKEGKYSEFEKLQN